VYAGCYHFDGEPPEPLGEFLRSYFVPGGAHYSEANFLDVAPGSHREYSNIAAGLAGYVVERAVGRSLGEYARQTIFAPLGMDDTAWSLAEVPPERHARLYVAQYGLSIPIPLYELTTYPDGGVRTSVADLAKLFVALLGDGAYEGTRILAKSSVDEMLRFHYTEANRPENVVLTEKNSGIFWSTKFDVTRVGHGGSDPGSKTEMLASLDRGIGVILFSNTSMAHDEARPFYDIFLELWKRAEATPRGGATPPVASGLAR
jgi:CubicO group peptidase (beta-lactamase class C family)